MSQTNQEIAEALDLTTSAFMKAAFGFEAAIKDLAKGLSVQPEPDYRAPIETWPFAANDAAPAAELDAALFHSAPVYCVPRMGQFEPMTTSGHAFLIAKNGLWLECRRPWLHLIWPLAKQDKVAMPYGELKPTVEIAFGTVPHDVLRSFAGRGRTSLPNERGAWMSWEHGFDDNPRLVWSNPIDTSGTPATLEYDRPEQDDNHCPCIDLHTHGLLPAGFSTTDNEDDAGDVKIAIVLGNLDQPVPSIAARLCCLGLFLPIAVKAEEVFGEQAGEQSA